MNNHSSYVMGFNAKEVMKEIDEALLELREIRLQEGKSVEDIDKLLNK